MLALVVDLEIYGVKNEGASAIKSICGLCSGQIASTFGVSLPAITCIEFANMGGYDFVPIDWSDSDPKCGKKAVDHTAKP